MSTGIFALVIKKIFIRAPKSTRKVAMAISYKTSHASYLKVETPYHDLANYDPYNIITKWSTVNLKLPGASHGRS